MDTLLYGEETMSLNDIRLNDISSALKLKELEKSFQMVRTYQKARVWQPGKFTTDGQWI